MCALLVMGLIHFKRVCIAIHTSNHVCQPWVQWASSLRYRQFPTITHYVNFRLAPLLAETASAADSPPGREILPVLSRNSGMGKAKTDHPRQRSGRWVGLLSPEPSQRPRCRSSRSSASSACRAACSSRRRSCVCRSRPSASRRACASSCRAWSTSRYVRRYSPRTGS